MLVCAASVLGLSCRLAIAGRLAELSETLVPLERAMTAHLLEEHGAPADRLIAFPHPLVQAAAYHSLGPAHRAELHERAATLVPDEASSLRHRVAAARGADPQLAADLIIFGIQLSRRGAWDAAADALLSASRLTADGPERDQRTLMAAEYMLLGGAVDDVLALVDEIERQAPTARRGFVLGSLAMTSGRYDRAQEMLAAAYDAMRPGTRPPACRGDRRAARASAHGSRARPRRGAVGDQVARRKPRTVARLRLALGPGDRPALCRPGPGGGGRGGGTASGRLPAATIVPLDGYLGRGYVRCVTDDPAAAREDLAPVAERLRRRGPAHQAIEALTMLATAEYRMGDWDDASVHGQLAASLAEDADQTWLLAGAHAAACAPLAGRGDWDVGDRPRGSRAACRRGCRRRIRRGRPGRDGGSTHRPGARRPRVRDPRTRAAAAAGGSRRHRRARNPRLADRLRGGAGRPRSLPRCGDRRLTIRARRSGAQARAIDRRRGPNSSDARRGARPRGRRGGLVRGEPRDPRRSPSAVRASLDRARVRAIPPARRVQPCGGLATRRGSGTLRGSRRASVRHRVRHRPGALRHGAVGRRAATLAGVSPRRRCRWRDWCRPAGPTVRWRTSSW